MLQRRQWKVVFGTRVSSVGRILPAVAEGLGGDEAVNDMHDLTLAPIRNKLGSTNSLRVVKRGACVAKQYRDLSQVRIDTSTWPIAIVPKSWAVSLSWANTVLREPQRERSPAVLPDEWLGSRNLRSVSGWLPMQGGLAHPNNPQLNRDTVLQKLVHWIGRRNPERRVCFDVSLRALDLMPSKTSMRHETHQKPYLAPPSRCHMKNPRPPDSRQEDGGSPLSLRRPQPCFGFDGGVAGVARDTVGVATAASEAVDVPYAFVAVTVTV